MTAPSTAARLARQAERLEAAMAAAIAQLTMVLPALNIDETQAVLEAAVPIPADSGGAGRPPGLPS